MTVAAPPPSATESDIVAAQYGAWVYPAPVADLAEAVAGRDFHDIFDPSHARAKLWPRKVEPDDLDILVAGCGTNQAALYAFNNPGCRVVGIDLSEASLGHEAYLKERHGLGNLELRRMSLGDAGSLGRLFDLVVCTGVLHHLPDPDAGLRRLRDVLEPAHGLIGVLLYGYYPRFGVYMMQEAFRALGLRQDADGVGLVRHAIQNAPAWHSVRSYMEIAPDLGYDSGLVDTFLHPMDRAYTVPQVLKLAADNGLRLQAWLDNLDYAVSSAIADPEDPLRRRIEALPPAQRWQLVELVAQSHATHRFILCRPERDEAGYRLDFAGDAWLGYVPGLRREATLSAGRAAAEEAPPAEAAAAAGPWRSLARALAAWRKDREPDEDAGQPAPAARPTIRRRWHESGLTGAEAALLAEVDGARSIGEILEGAARRGGEVPPPEAARALFARMAEWDHLLFRIP